MKSDLLKEQKKINGGKDENNNIQNEREKEKKKKKTARDCLLLASFFLGQTPLSKQPSRIQSRENNRCLHRLLSALKPCNLPFSPAQHSRTFFYVQYALPRLLHI